MMSIAHCELRDSVNHLKVDRITLFWVIHESIFALVSFCVSVCLCVRVSMCVSVCLFHFPLSVIHVGVVVASVYLVCVVRVAVLLHVHSFLVRLIIFCCVCVSALLSVCFRCNG